jgi:Mg2+ and Co2+ transporter CorA
MAESWWDIFLAHAQQEWGVITGAPIACLMLVIASATITWLILKHHYKERLATLEAHAKLHKDTAEHLAANQKREAISDSSENVVAITLPKSEIKHPIEIQYGTSPAKLITVTVRNKADREERVQALAIHLVRKDGNTEVITDEKRNKPLCIKSIKRAATIPHVMAPLRKLAIRQLLSLNQLQQRIPKQKLVLPIIKPVL